MSERDLHFQLMRLKHRGTTALGKAQTVSLVLYQAGIFLNSCHQIIAFSMHGCLCTVCFPCAGEGRPWGDMGQVGICSAAACSRCSFACKASCQFAYLGIWTLQITPYDQQIRCHLHASVSELYLSPLCSQTDARCFGAVQVVAASCCSVTHSVPLSL